MSSLRQPIRRLLHAAVVGLSSAQLNLALQLQAHVLDWRRSVRTMSVGKSGQR